MSGAAQAGDARSRPSEEARLARLAEYRILGTEAEREFDDIAHLAAGIFKAPSALLCIAESDRHWFKARVNVPLEAIDRSISFCDTTILCGDVFVIPDALEDPRFASLPNVIGAPYVRFYAGVPLIADEGFVLGTLCVLDMVARDGIAPFEKEALRSLARLAVDRLELRRRNRVISEAQAKAEAAEREARAAHARLSEAIEVLPEAIVFLDADDRYILWNKRYAELFSDIAHLLRPGIAYSDILKASFLAGSHIEDIPAKQVDAWIDERIRQVRISGHSHEQRLKDGRWLRFEERRTSDGGSIGVRIDITDVKRREEAQRLLFEANPVPMWLCDALTLDCVAVNEAAVEAYGLPRASVIGTNVLDLHAPEDRPFIERALMEEGAVGDGSKVFRHKRCDGSEIDVLPFARRIGGVTGEHVLFAAIDVTERVRAEERVRHLAHHDVLTGLANRELFQLRLEEALRHARRASRSVALCMLDLDHFKEVNDTLGHAAGDALLKAVSERLMRAVRNKTDTVARLGGDEFAVILCDLEDETMVDPLMARLVQALSEPLVIDGKQLSVAGSFGVALFPGDAGDVPQLMQCADVALYQSKAKGRSRLTIFDPEMRRRIEGRVKLAASFRTALAAREIVPHYQPIIDLAHGTLRGFEALARWQHPELGLRRAADFAEVFQQTDLAAALGGHMLEAVTDDIRRWLDDDVACGIIGLNVTAADLRSESFVDDVLACLRRKDLPTTVLAIEPSEPMLVERDMAAVARTINGLRAEGLKVTLDDFGTGQGSLLHLKELDVTAVKIDQSFVRDMTIDADDATIVGAVISLGTSLGIITIAEGIEAVEQFDMLLAAGCTYGQGFLFGGPLPAADVPRLTRRFAEAPWNRRRGPLAASALRPSLAPAFPPSNG